MFTISVVLVQASDWSASTQVEQSSVLGHMANVGMEFSVAGQGFDTRMLPDAPATGSPPIENANWRQLPALPA